jgi:HK97 family phage major capsid protein
MNWREKLAAALKKMQGLAETAEQEGRDFTAEERQQLQGWMTEAKAAREKIKEAEGDDELRKAIAALGADLPEPTTGAASDGKGNAGKGKSLGEQFLTSSEYQGWLKSVAPDGRIPDSMKGLRSPSIGFKDLLTGDSVTSAGALVYSEQTNIIVPYGRRPLTLFDIITQGTTNSDTVEYVRVTAETNAAAPVAEATAAGGSSGYKPESSMTLERVTEPVKTTAHWIPVTKRALSDAGQLRTLIDNFLRYGLMEEWEDQAVTGSGVGENFTGLDTVSGTQDQAWDTNILVTAYLLHPTDWETIQLTRDDSGAGAGTGGFLFGSPAGTQSETLWGLPVVECEAVPQGWGWVGDFRLMVYWNREQASISVSDSHSDFFVRNLVAILAEQRGALGILKPNGFVEMDLTP